MTLRRQTSFQCGLPPHWLLSNKSRVLCSYFGAFYLLLLSSHSHSAPSKFSLKMDGTFSRLQYIPRRQLQVRKTFRSRKLPIISAANGRRRRATGHQHEIQMVKMWNPFTMHVYEFTEFEWRVGVRLCELSTQPSVRGSLEGKSRNLWTFVCASLIGSLSRKSTINCVSVIGTLLSSLVLW